MKINMRGEACLSIFASALVLSWSPGAFADDFDAIKALASKHKDLYVSEISDKSIFEREFTLRTRIFYSEGIGANYDEGLNEVHHSTDDIKRDLEHMTIERCVRTGTGAGVTRLGVRFPYEKYSCFLLDVQAKGEVKFEPESTFSATPAEYRVIKEERGISVDVRLKVRPQPNTAVFAFEQRYYTPTLADAHPYEARIGVWTFHATVLSMTYVRPSVAKPARKARVSPK